MGYEGLMKLLRLLSEAEEFVKLLSRVLRKTTEVRLLA